MKRCQPQGYETRHVNLTSQNNITCVRYETEDYELAVIGFVFSILLLASAFLISLFVLTLIEAEKCKKNMKKLGKFQREFIITPDVVSRLHYYTPRQSKIGTTLLNL